MYLSSIVAIKSLDSSSQDDFHKDSVYVGLASCADAGVFNSNG